jgi:hypothetical protein
MTNSLLLRHLVQAAFRYVDFRCLCYTLMTNSEIRYYTQKYSNTLCLDPPSSIAFPLLGQNVILTLLSPQIRVGYAQGLIRPHSSPEGLLYEL